MKREFNEKYFLIGLIIFYLVTFLAPNKPVYFLAYIISTYFFYKASNDIRISLIFSLVLSFFSDVGLAGSLFLMEPDYLNLGSGFWISPLTMIIVLLIPLSLSKSLRYLTIVDIYEMMFLVWNAIVFLIFPTINVFYGVITLVEMTLAYYLLRFNLKKSNFKYITYILLSMVIYQSIIGIGQYILHQPIGLISETINFERPFGLTATEEHSMYRVSGTFGHANMYAVVILVLFPFLFIFKKWYGNILILLSLINLLFTFSRAGWFIGLFLSFYLIYKFYKPFLLKTLNDFRLFFGIVSLILFLIMVFGRFIYLRLEDIPFAFEQKGSMSVRFKLAQEAFHLITLYPITGIGINRFQEIASVNPVTDVFQLLRFSSATRIHNIFLEIATEIGLVGLILFCLFLISIFQYYRQSNSRSKNKIYDSTILTKNAAIISLIGLILIASFHPFFQASPFRLFYLLAAIIIS